ncbi:hypothetical protein PoB_000242600 [Plakobranchus ocellatus]|uniref:Uncharacterized protein n=1 Tax=Plakobranchus ocellatus TaxID=259542 RepID=A0AAV3X9V4_9GAST|nr:hypothetical protein PoB_000242600 [Plakobranchus ocellatus]
MSGRTSRVHGTKARKVQITSTAPPRPSTPTVPPTSDPIRRHRRPCQDEVATATRIFKDTARPIQPFPKRHPSEYREAVWLTHLPPSGPSTCPRQAFSRQKAPPSGKKIKINK